MDANIVNDALHLLVRFATIGGGLWAIWGVVVLAGDSRTTTDPASSPACGSWSAAA